MEEKNKEANPSCPSGREVVESGNQFVVPSTASAHFLLSKKRRKRQDGPFVPHTLPPPHTRRSTPSRVLVEDDYVHAVQSLVERDFFPDLRRLRAMRRLVEARESQDELEVNRARKVLECLTPVTEMRTPLSGAPIAPSTSTAATAQVEDQRDEEEIDEPFTREEPSLDKTTVRVTLIDGRVVPLDLDSMGLDTFLRKYTSEDNASFETIVNEEMKKRIAKEEWIESRALAHNRNLERIHSAELTNIPLKQLENTQLCTTAEPRSALMFLPNALPDEQQPALFGFQAKEVRPRNSRFPTAMQEEEGDSALAVQREKQEEQLNRQKEDRALDSMIREGKFISSDRRNFAQTPAMVPGAYGAPASPLMTWGTIGSTPLLVGGNLEGGGGNILDVEKQTEEEIARWAAADVLGGPKFEVPDAPAKEVAAHALVDRSNHRNKKQSRSHRLRLRGSSSSSSLLPAASPLVQQMLQKRGPCSILHTEDRSSSFSSASSSIGRSMKGSSNKKRRKLASSNSSVF